MRQVLTDFAEEVNVGTQRLTKFHEKITREDEVNLENEISDLDKLFQEKGKKKKNKNRDLFLYHTSDI